MTKSGTLTVNAMYSILKRWVQYLYCIDLTGAWPVAAPAAWNAGYRVSSNSTLTENPWNGSVWFASADPAPDPNMYLYEIVNWGADISLRATIAKSDNNNSENGPIVFQWADIVLYGESVWGGDGYFHLISTATSAVTKYYLTFTGGLAGAAHAFDHFIFAGSDTGRNIFRLQDAVATEVASTIDSARNLAFFGIVFFSQMDDVGAVALHALRLDTDNDGTPDCNDNCPDDPAKTAPGNCGCGVADTDSDGDGALDCNDGCPNDPVKTAPGDCGCGIADADIDYDGTPDCSDGCPDDPAKTEPGICGCGAPDTDTDKDGQADCIDNDADNDGLSNIAEADLGTDPTNADTDGEGIADGDEVDFGSDPLSADDGPGVPVLVLPENGAADAALPVQLEAAYSENTSSNLHGATRWQVARDEDFSSPVMDVASETHLLTLAAPDLVLTGETVYYWRARFIDTNGLPSMWSGIGGFATAAENPVDENGNGPPDDQEFSGDPDIVPEAAAGWRDDLYFLDVIAEDGAPVQVGLRLSDDGSSLLRFSHTPAADMDEACPVDLAVGVLSIKLKVPGPGVSTLLRLYFSPTPLNENSLVYKHDAANGWLDYTGYTEPCDDFTCFTFELADGGYGDADGVVNGIIVDPLGPSVSNDTDASASSGGGGGCFICEILESEKQD